MARRTAAVARLHHAAKDQAVRAGGPRPRIG
jgi:hypothetical protein